MRRLFVLGAVVSLATGWALAQSVISAHSGVVHYIEGRVLLDGKPVISKFGQFPELKDDQELRTEEGRAEMLLTPGVFLRIGENSSVRMISNRLTDTRVELVSGAALVECADILKDNAITLVYKDWTVALEKKGLYRLDSDPARLRVFDGEALVSGNKQEASVRKQKELFFGPVLSADRFESKETDELYSWSSHRSESLSYANVSAAKSLLDSGSSYGTGGWQYNPWYGMFTFVPLGGVYYSPFGYGFYSPGQVGYFYQPRYWSGGTSTGYRSVPWNSAGSTLGSPSTTASSSIGRGAPPSSGGISRGGISSGGGGISGGRGGGAIGGGRR
jgi:hypothetical protein